METKQPDNLSLEAEQELKLIRKIMEDSRQVVIENGSNYIFWGVLVTAGLIYTYAMKMLKVEHSYTGIVWLALVIAGIAVDIIISKKEDRAKRVRTFAGKILGSVGFATGTTMIIIGFVGTVSGAYSSIYICPMISAVLAIAYYTSGSIQHVKMLKYISFGWWAGAVILFALPSIHTLLVFAIMMIVLQIIPGIILYRNSKIGLSSGSNE